tara:strand:- start:214 stop:393 length:180 start_codon:yes stop_codon:yes gene_type:complete
MAAAIIVPLAPNLVGGMDRGFVAFSSGVRKLLEVFAFCPCSSKYFDRYQVMGFLSYCFL